MNLTPVLGLIFALLAAGLTGYFYFTRRRREDWAVRNIPAFTRLRKAVGLAVEAGTRLHVSLGRGAVTSTEIAAGLAGLSVLERVARAASISDRPPAATSGDGAVAILSQDTLRSAYRSLGAETQYDPAAGRLTGITPFSFAAGALPVIQDEQVSANVLIGNFGNEVALITDAASRSGSLTIAGTDDLPGQSVIYATATEPLIGEEVFASGAYLGAGPVHEASLHMQDWLRFVIIAAILLGSIITFLGLDSLLSGGLR
ncbi:MAG: DUF6754 domain-containing protein [Omnitrophica WOR_2 bacterium]